jgi:hypothetical protein
MIAKPAHAPATDENAWIRRSPAPPSRAVSASTVSARGWQYVRFVPSPAKPAEMTAYRGCAWSSSASVDDVLPP